MFHFRETLFEVVWRECGVNQMWGDGVIQIKFVKSQRERERERKRERERIY